MRTLSPVLRAALRIALPPVLAITGLSTANATPAVGSGWMDVKMIPEGFNVCVHGEVPVSSRVVGGEWKLSFSGLRFDETGSTWLVDNPPWTTDDWEVSEHCEPVYTFGFPYGEMQTDWAYVAAGEYVVVQSMGGATWEPSKGLKPWTVNPTT